MQEVIRQHSHEDVGDGVANRCLDSQRQQTGSRFLRLHLLSIIRMHEIVFAAMRHCNAGGAQLGFEASFNFRLLPANSTSVLTSQRLKHLGRCNHLPNMSLRVIGDVNQRSAN